MDSTLILSQNAVKQPSLELKISRAVSIQISHDSEQNDYVLTILKI